MPRGVEAVHRRSDAVHIDFVARIEDACVVCQASEPSVSICDRTGVDGAVTPASTDPSPAAQAVKTSSQCERPSVCVHDVSS